MITVTFDETKWQVVPKEPTEVMVVAAMDRHDAEPLTSWGHMKAASDADVYKAMLAAAPSPNAMKDGE